MFEVFPSLDDAVKEMPFYRRCIDAVQCASVVGFGCYELGQPDVLFLKLLPLKVLLLLIVLP
jgi:hypothetical protein